MPTRVCGWSGGQLEPPVEPTPVPRLTLADIGQFVQLLQVLLSQLADKVAAHLFLINLVVCLHVLNLPQEAGGALVFRGLHAKEGCQALPTGQAKRPIDYFLEVAPIPKATA